MAPVDLRSDTVTRPTPAMREAMARAEVGDDVFGDDPTVRALEERAAAMFGLEAGLLFPSGTQSNLAALMAHCARGEEVILGQDAHTYRYEGGGAAVLGSIQPQPIANEPDGTLDLDKIAAAVKPDDPHFAITRLLALENTIGGKVIGRDYLARAVTLAWKKGLSTHLDGARIFNAAVKVGMPVDQLCAGFDTVSVCLSKGLGAPAGTVLVGHPGLIARARRIRKMLGGGMRQVGSLAAAGLYAFEHNIARLADDHANARRLAEGLAAFDAFEPNVPRTNIVVANVRRGTLDAWLTAFRERGLLAVPFGRGRMRMVTHLNITIGDIDEALRRVREAVEAVQA